MRYGQQRFLLPLFLLLVLPLASARAQQPAIDPKADEALKRMSETLASAKTFSFQAHSIADQILPDGQKIQLARNQKVTVSRPDKIRASVVGDLDDLEFVYDGKQVTLLNPREKLYASTDAPDSIDKTLDMLATRYGMAIPLADLVFADPYKSLIEHARSAQDLGLGYVFDTRCLHLAFRQEAVDWQIWIDPGTHLPRKIVITYKEQPGFPQFTAFLSNWNLQAQIPESEFTFTPPAGARKTGFSAPIASTRPAADDQ